MLEGVGCSMTFLGFASSGGTDILGLLISKKNKTMTVGKVTLTINFIIYAICGCLFSVEVAIYSLIASIFCSFIIDKLHWQNNSVSVNILSEKYEEIAKEIVNNINRDATIIDGVGAYSNKNKKLLVSIMSQYELNMLKKVVYEIDENAFIFIHPNISVLGNFEKRLN